jgi:hypothetical protein
VCSHVGDQGFLERRFIGHDESPVPTAGRRSRCVRNHLTGAANPHAEIRVLRDEK